MESRNKNARELKLVSVIIEMALLSRLTVNSVAGISVGTAVRPALALEYAEASLMKNNRINIITWADILV